jgi:hypothetical protein
MTFKIPSPGRLYRDAAVLELHSATSRDTVSLLRWMAEAQEQPEILWQIIDAETILVRELFHERQLRGLGRMAYYVGDVWAARGAWVDLSGFLAGSDIKGDLRRGVRSALNNLAHRLQKEKFDRVVAAVDAVKLCSGAGSVFAAYEPEWLGAAIVTDPLKSFANPLLNPANSHGILPAT